ncbi:hypothetical protein Hanom_Chr09g00860251 [Helianthus anomalus]
MRLSHFCHFSQNLKPFASGSLWFHFYCHFGPIIKSAQISKKKIMIFVLFLKGKMVIFYFILF